MTLRPSLIICRMAGRPAAVPGIFTYRLGSSMSSLRWRAAAIVPSVSLASEGATSTDTKPSTPSLASCTGRRMARASRMSAVTMSQ